MLRAICPFAWSLFLTVTRESVTVFLFIYFPSPVPFFSLCIASELDFDIGYWSRLFVHSAAWDAALVLSSTVLSSFPPDTIGHYIFNPNQHHAQRNNGHPSHLIAKLQKHPEDEHYIEVIVPP